MKIFYDKTYIFEKLMILVIRYDLDVYPSSILLLCESPGYKAFKRFWFELSPEKFESILSYIGETGQKSFDLLNQKVDNNEEDCTVVPHQEIGETLYTEKLLIKAQAIEPEEDNDWVDFQIHEILKSNHNRNKKDGDHRFIHDIALDIYILALQHGYEYGAMFDYLNAMMELKTVDDTYGSDRASYIVKAFLGNIQYWRIDEIKPLRMELKKLVDHKP